MALSNMMKHYLETKQQHTDCILFYRLGDFYEMFFEDAEICSKELDLTLTGKDCGLEQRAPMCGIPFHAANQYIQKLIEKDYKVAICEQLSAPKKGTIVERGVIRVITPGTVFDNEMLDDEKNNFIASIYYEKGDCALSWIDVSTGEFFTTYFHSENVLNELNQALTRISPSEIISNSACDFLNNNLTAIKEKNLPSIASINNFSFNHFDSKILITRQFTQETLRSLQIENMPLNVISVAAILFYLNDTQKQFLCHINSLQIVNSKMYMALDTKARKNLDLIENSITNKKQGSLLGVLNHCETSMGARMLRAFINEPLVDKSAIEHRLNGVEELRGQPILLTALKEELHYIRDIERLTARVSSGLLLPRQAKALLESFVQIPKINNLLKDCSSSIIKNCVANLDGLNDVVTLLSSSIDDNPPLNFKDGNYIKKGFNTELDEYRMARLEGTNWLAQLEAKEKELTNIKNLKIGYNSNFGYYIEVLNSQKDLVPYRYVRKQTTISAERYITEELKVLEDKILNAEENAAKLELKIYNEIRAELLKHVHKFQQVARSFATIDVLVNFANISLKNNYTRPQINESGIYEIKEGRHPVIENYIKGGVFNPNDTFLNDDENIMLITGPNMAGKSTYMRQVALIVLMTHMGCYVPASFANISITDRIFTRIGASDDLALGQSTFMVEMAESATILNSATERSLIILDEVGRGTSTYDGLSIAYAIVDYLSSNIKAKTLFATHYHELVELEHTHKGVVNYSVAVKEFGGEIIFLHKIVKGGTDKSFGIEVAQLAGLPKSVITSAKQYLSKIDNQITIQKEDNGPRQELINVKEKSIINALKNINVDSLTPFKALELIACLQDKIKENDNED